MFSQIWKKYLPVIAILIKRSASADQSLHMNQTDFKRASGGRKIRYSFNNLQLNKGRILNSQEHSSLAKDFAQVLLETEPTRGLLRNVHIEFAMSNDFQLTIINRTEAPTEVVESE